MHNRCTSLQYECFSASPLVPPLDTKLGIEVQKYRQMLDSVKVPQITFGLLKNENLSIKGLQIPAGMKQGFNKQYIGRIENYYFLQFAITKPNIMLKTTEECLYSYIFSDKYVNRK